MTEILMITNCLVKMIQQSQQQRQKLHDLFKSAHGNWFGFKNIQLNIKCK